AAIALVMAGLLFARLRDTPESVGLPEVEGTHVADAPAKYGALLWRQVFSDKYIWIVSAANFFVYTIPYAVLDWGPTILKEAKGIELSSAGWMVAAFEVAGLAGMLATGWLTDRVFRGRAAPVSLICMLLCGATVLAFGRAPGRVAGDAAARAVWLNTGLLMG